MLLAVPPNTCRKGKIRRARYKLSDKTKDSKHFTYCLNVSRCSLEYRACNTVYKDVVCCCVQTLTLVVEISGFEPLTS